METLVLHKLFLPVYDAQEALRIAHNNVARFEPPIGRKSLRISLRILIVSSARNSTGRRVRIDIQVRSRYKSPANDDEIGLHPYALGNVWSPQPELSWLPFGYVLTVVPNQPAL